MKCGVCGKRAYYRRGNEGWERWECLADGWAVEAKDGRLLRSHEDYIDLALRGKG